MKKIIGFTFLVFGLLSLTTRKVSSQSAVEGIHWMSIEEAYLAAQKVPKKTVIDVYTDWCGWCKVMDRNTFTNPEVISYINENYYAVKLDAESKKSFSVGGVNYNYNEQSRANDIAIALLQGKMSYPSMVYLDEKFNMIQPIPGYMNARSFHEIITFLGENHFKSEPFEQYKKGTYYAKYQNTIPEEKGN